MRRLLAALVANVVLAWRFFRRSLWLAVALGLVLGLVVVTVLLTTSTYYVAPNGTGTDCSSGNPCSLATAVGQVNAGAIVGDSTIRLSAGRYGQALQTLSGSGSAGAPIVWDFAEGAYLSGCREAIPPEAWTLVSGMTATYQVPFDDEGAGWAPTTALQCSQTEFAPITVRESATSINVHPLNFPPGYHNQYKTVKQVDAQGGTFWFDDAANLVYVHTYDDQAPAAYHELYFRSAGWGALTVTGSYHEFRGLRVEFANSGGFAVRVISPSVGVTIRHGVFQSATLNITGDDVEVSDTTFESVASQTPDPASHETCYDHHAAVDGSYGRGTSTGFCWNYAGDGTALTVDAGADRVLLQRLLIRNNWNGISIDEGTTAVQLLDSNLSGANNHCFGAHGTGHVFKRLIVDNCQESYFQNQDTGDLHDTVFEENLFPRGVLLESSRNSNVRFVRNIVSVLRVNGDPTPYTEIDCNLFIPSVTGADADLVATINPSGHYTTLEAWHAVSPWDKRSAALPFTAWEDGTQFRSYSTTPGILDFVADFHPASASAQAVTMPASCGRVGPYDYVP